MIRFIIAFPVLIVLIVFALSNPQPVKLAFWPTDYFIQTPLSFAILIGAGGAFILGALFVWFPALGTRARANRAERAARRLEAQVADLKKKNTPATAAAR
jgi:uncharacterized integral membrane protein